MTDGIFAWPEIDDIYMYYVQWTSDKKQNKQTNKTK